MTRNNSNRIPVPELAASFPGLTLSQLRLLGYCAYRGGFPPNPWTITLYDGHFKLAKGRTERDRNALTEAGLLKDGQVLPRDYFRIATAIIRHFPEWIPAYSECARYRSDTTAWLWEMARVLAPENLFAARELRFPSKGVFTDYFLSVLFNDGYAPFLHLFPPKEAEVLLEDLNEGYTREYIRVKLLRNEASPGSILKGRITGRMPDGRMEFRTN